MTMSDVRSHAEMVAGFARGSLERSGVDPLIARSWKRSIDTYRLDPGRVDPPQVLSANSLRDYREPLEPLLAIARSGIENLYRQTRDAGYVVLLTDRSGVTVDFMNNPPLDRELRRAGLYLGSCWNESLEGTCAVGLCVAEKAPVTVHHGEHFRVPNSSLTCSAAPIASETGEFIAVLDASALHSPQDKRSQHLVMQLVAQTARMIENAYFLHHFQNQWVLRVNRQLEFLEVAVQGLLAVNEEGRILAANQALAGEMRDDKGSVVGLHLSEVFGIDFEHLAASSQGSAPQALTLRSQRSGTQCFGLVRTPHRSSISQSRGRYSATFSASPALHALAGGDERMNDNIGRAQRVLDKGIPILLHGETGTGKEAFAKAIHEASGRATGPFVALNCAAIPESLIESELFGYREGAFTGARAKGARGKILQADGGTLFLDEIGDMPLQLQTRLLRVLAEREVMALGAEKPVPVDLQVICASHRDLSQRVADGSFREDLYYRLNGVAITLPALRQRSDRRPLIESILAEEAASLKAPVPRIEPSAMGLLLHYRWPGNIRQLKNVLRSAVALCDGRSIDESHLPPELRQAPSLTQDGEAAMFQGHGEFPSMPSARSSVDEALPRDPEAAAIVLALRRRRWSITQAAQDLGMSRSTIYRKMERHGIVPPNHQD